METLDESVRKRLRDAMTQTSVTQRELATRLGWTQSRVGKILTAHIGLTVKDLGALCDALGIAAVEAVRDPGLEFVADLTPHELRLLERYRLVKSELQQAVATILDVKKPVTPQRYAKAPGRSRLPRPPITDPVAAASK